MEELERYLPYGRLDANYLVNCSRRLKFVYVETPKVACSTIKRVLQLLEVDRDATLVPDDVHDREASPLLSPFDSSFDIDELFGGEAGYFVFAFVRNPFSRVLSAYLDKVINNAWEKARLLPGLGFSPEEDVDFRSFLEAVASLSEYDRDIHWKSQSYILQPGTVSYDFVGRFENFPAAFQAVVKKLSPGKEMPIQDNSVTHHKTNAKDKIAQYIGSVERDLILSIYEDDFMRFCYSHDPAFSRC